MKVPVLTLKQTCIWLKLRKLEGADRQYYIPFYVYLRLVCKPKIYLVNGRAHRALRHVYVNGHYKPYLKA